MNAAVLNAPATGHSVRRARAPIPVQPILDRLEKVVHVGSSLYALLKRVLMLVLERVAKVFKVNLDQRGLDEAGGRAEAAFEADATASGTAAVQEAAAQASQELNAWVQEIMNKPKEHWVQQFSGSPDAAPAFLAHSLDQLAAAIKQAKADHELSKQQLDAGIAAQAKKMGVEEDAVRALLQGGKGLPEGMAQADQGLKELADLAQKAETAAQHIVRLQLSFCDHCVAAMQVDPQQLGDIARGRAASIGDPQLWNAVELALAAGSSHEPNFDAKSVAPAQSPLNSAATGEGPLSSAVTQASRPSRSQRFSGPIDDDVKPPAHDFDDGGDENGGSAQRGPRQR